MNILGEIQNCTVEWKELGEVVDYEQPTKYIVSSKAYAESNEIPVLTAGQSFILGYTNEKDGIYQASKNNPVIIFDDFTTSKQWVDFQFKVKSSAMKMLKIKDEFENKVLLRYAWHYLGTITYKPDQHGRQWIGTYSKFLIPIPPLKIQEKIVQILDKMTEYVTELTSELTSELSDSEIDSDFQNFKYIYIDDPISSLDDNNIIDSAIFLKDVIAKSENTDLKFILSSHQPLFYNVLYNEIRFEKRIKKTCFHVMKKVIENNNEVKYILTDVEKDSPFGYHLKVREELRRAVDSGRVEKFHYALFRNLLEKTATFLGYGRWEEVLLGLEVVGEEITKENIEPYAQRIDLFTHNRQSDLEFRELQEREKNTLIELFNSFEIKYKFNQKEENENG